MEVVTKALTLIGLVVLGIGLYIAYSTSAKVKAVASWPTVPGYVVESAIMWEVEAGSSRRTSYSYAYRLKVRTDYMIDGQYFSNTKPGIKEIGDLKIFRTDPWKNLPDENMVRLFKQVPQGTTVPVHYNPKNKAESYIFPEIPFWDLYTFPFVLVVIGGIFLLIRWWIVSRTSGLV